MKTFSDNQLIHSFHQGNNRALEELINRYKDKIFQTLSILSNDNNIAEDLFQDVFIKIIKAIRNGQYSDQNHFLSWATRIARNHFIDHYRKSKHKASTFIRSDNSWDDTQKFDPFDVLALETSDYNADKRILEKEEEAEKKQQSERIHELLKNLPFEQREVIVLKHFAGLSFKEIAELTNCSINTALGRMRYALINLRKMVPETNLI